MEIEKLDSKRSILVADDDIDDQFMLKEAFASLNFDGEIQCVENGEELLDYLNNKGKYTDPSFLLPKLILLDLNMPKIDGRQCLKIIKANINLCKIPTIIFSTSNNPEDISQSYELGANSYVIKPYSYNELIEVVDIIKKYWFSAVKIP